MKMRNIWTCQLLAATRVRTRLHMPVTAPTKNALPIAAVVCVCKGLTMSALLHCTFRHTNCTTSVPATNNRFSMRFPPLVWKRPECLLALIFTFVLQHCFCSIRMDQTTTSPLDALCHFAISLCPAVLFLLLFLLLFLPLLLLRR